MRYYRVEIMDAGRRVVGESVNLFEKYGQGEVLSTDTVELIVAAAVAKHFEQLFLSDEEIEQTLEQCWAFV